jgi:hypothetical protein
VGVPPTKLNQEDKNRMQSSFAGRAHDYFIIEKITNRWTLFIDDNGFL